MRICTNDYVISYIWNFRVRVVGSGRIWLGPSGWKNLREKHTRVSLFFPPLTARDDQERGLLACATQLSEVYAAVMYMYQKYHVTK